MHDRLCATILVIFVLNLGIRGAHAEVGVSLPFDGRYRAGRFFPVRVVLHSGPASVRISGEGALRTTIENAREGEIVAPVLAVSDSLASIAVEGNARVELKPAGEHERLVGIADADIGVAKVLFPSDQLHPVTLDMGRPLLEPVIAWTGLDAIVLSASARARVNDAQLSALLAAGVVIIVNDANAPDDRWPWEHLQDAWVLRHEVAGPRESVVPEAFSPTYAWDRGLPAATRRQIVLLAAIFAILAVGLSMWRSRYSTVGFIGLCVVAGGLVYTAYLRRPVELAMEKTIALKGPRLTQLDQWTWRASLREGRFTQTASGLTLPVFGTAHQIGKLDMQLKFDGMSGPVAYEFRIGPGESIAFVTREVMNLATPGEFSATDSVWKDFAGELYGARGYVLGDAPVGDGRSATFVAR